MSCLALLALLALSATLEGCTSDGSDLPADLDVIATTPAAGTIAGTAFQLGSRYMNVSGSDLYFDLLSDVTPDCTKDETTASYPFLIFFTPSTPGTYELGQTQFVTFVDAPSHNLIVGHGVVTVDAITATEVRGGLHVFDAEFGEIDGRFDGKLCGSN